MVASSVEQNNRLSALPKIFNQRLGKPAANGPAFSGRSVKIHIDQLYLRHLSFSKPGGKSVKSVFSFLCHATGLQRRSGGGQQTKGTVFPAAEAGHLSGVISGTGFRFIGVLLLFIDHDQAKLLHRSKYRGAGTNHDFSLPAPDTLPFVHSLPEGKAAVKHGNAVAKALTEPADGLSRQRDLRHHDDDAFSLLANRLDQF